MSRLTPFARSESFPDVRFCQGSGLGLIALAAILSSGIVTLGYEAPSNERAATVAIEHAGGKVGYDDQGHVVTIGFDATTTCTPDDALLVKIAGLVHLRTLLFFGEGDPTQFLALPTAEASDSESLRAKIARATGNRKMSEKEKAFFERMLKKRSESKRNTGSMETLPSNLRKAAPRLPLRGKHVWHPGVTDAGIERLRDLNQLRSLDLSGTMVSGRGLVYLRGMRLLEELNLSFRDLRNEDLAHLAGLSTLEFLVVEGDGITDDGLVHLEQLRNLRMLSVRSQSLTADGLKHLRKLTKMDSLTLTSPKIETLESLAGMTRLTSLEVRGTALIDEGLAPIANLTELQILRLTDTRIGDDGLNYIRKLKKLAQLDLRNTRITDRGLDTLAQLSGCQYLNIAETGVASKGASTLAAKLPNTKILY